MHLEPRGCIEDGCILESKINCAKFQQNQKTFFVHPTTTHTSVNNVEKGPKYPELSPSSSSSPSPSPSSSSSSSPSPSPSPSLPLSHSPSPFLPRYLGHSLSPPFLSLSRHFAWLVKKFLLPMGTHMFLLKTLFG